MRTLHTIRFAKIAGIALLLLLLSGACKEKYIAKTNYPYTGYLVVEGFIDAGGGTSTFTLSRTTALDSVTYRAENGAGLTVESQNGQSIPLYQDGSGRYSASGIPVQPGDKFRLHIFTADSREYLSDYVSPKITPPIDSVNWKEMNNGVQIYISSHDATDSTVYYRWRYDETWQYHARYFSSLVWDPTAQYSFRYRTDAEAMYTCWKADTSSGILLASTAKLASDVLSEQPVTRIAYSESFNKLFFRYSIQVYLEALSKTEYEWYDKLRKNTESLGSIFDALPSELTGNVHSVTDPTETVIGWVGCHTVTRNRIYIGRQELPSNPRLDDGYSLCSPDTLLFGTQAEQIRDAYSSGGYLIPVLFYVEKGALAPSGVIGTVQDCADCRLKGGVLMKPDFWQD